MLPVLVELDVMLEVDTVEVGEQLRLRFVSRSRRLRAQVLNQCLGVDLLLDVDWHHGNGEILRILLVLPLPHKLRVQRRIARVQHLLRCLLLIGHEVAQLFRGDIGPLIFVADGIEIGLRRFRLLLFCRHRTYASTAFKNSRTSVFAFQGSRTSKKAHRPNPPWLLTAGTHSARAVATFASLSARSWPLTSRIRFNAPAAVATRATKSGV